MIMIQMIRYDSIWWYMIWFDMIDDYSMIWFDSLILYDMAWVESEMRSMMQFNTIQLDIIFDTIQFDTLIIINYIKLYYSIQSYYLHSINEKYKLDMIYDLSWSYDMIRDDYDSLMGYIILIYIIYNIYIYL